MNKPDVLIGTLIIRKTAYAVDKFLQNQKNVQTIYPNSELIIATDEPDFQDELNRLLKTYEIEGKIVIYNTVKPESAQSNLWSVAAGRNVIRKYFLEKTDAGYVLFIDADMTCDPNVIRIMKNQIERGYDVVFSGYKLRHFNAFAIGMGCSIFSRKILDKISFRGIEFKNHHIVDEGTLFEFGAVQAHGKISKGIFLKTSHFIDKNKALIVEPRKLTLVNRVTTNVYLRYLLTRISLLIKRDISWELQHLFYP